MGYKDPNKQKEQQKRYYQEHKEELQIKHRAYKKAWRKANKEYSKAYNETHKEEVKAYQKAYKKEHKEEVKAYSIAYHAAHKEKEKNYRKAYILTKLNSLGQTKTTIRRKSQYYLRKYGKKIEGYEIHHCCTYNEPYKFIYCSRQMHLLIHEYLRAHNIDADTEHYEYIKHLLDDTVIKYNVD